MTTAAQRLATLSGLSGVSAAQMLRQIAAGATAGAMLVAYSGLPSATAATHLLHDVSTVEFAIDLKRSCAVHADSFVMIVALAESGVRVPRFP